MSIRKRNKRHISVTLVALLVLIVTAWNAIRLIVSISYRNVLIEYQADWVYIYIATSAAVWLLAGLLLFTGLWLGKAWAGKAATISAISYTTWYWFDRLVFQTMSLNWLFALVITIILLFFTFVALYQHHMIIHLSKKEAHERKS